MSFQRNFYLTFGTQIGILGVSALNSIIVSRALGAGGQGILALIITTSTLISLFLGGGLQWSNTYWVSKDKEKLNSIFLNSIYFTGLACLLSFIIYHLLGYKALSFYMPGALVVTIFIAVPLILNQSYNQAILQGLQVFTSYNAINILRSTSLLAIYVLLLIVLRLDIRFAAAGWLISILFASAASTYFVARKNTHFHLLIDWALLYKSVKVGGRAILTNLLWLLLSRSDIYLIGYFLDTRNVGYYSIAVLIAESLLIAPQVVGQLIMPKASASEPDSHILTAKINRSSILYTLISASIVAILARFILPLFFGKDFICAYPSLLCLLPGIIAINSSSSLGYYITGKEGYPFKLIAAMGAGLVINVSLNLMMIPKMGIAGAALASSIAYIVYVSLYCRFFKKITRQGFGEFLIPRLSDFAVFKNLRTAA